MLDSQIIQPNPADDRDEFERRLKKIICWTNEYSMQEAVEAILRADIVKQTAIKAVDTACQNSINGHLQQWDNARNRQEREQICGEPKRNRKQ